MLKIYNSFKEKVQLLQDVPPLVLRLLLAVVFYGPAMTKLGNIDGIIMWFDSLGIPFPTLNAYLATATETAGFVLLAVGLGTRLISIPLIITMLVAFFTVHIDNGWSVIGQSSMPEIASRMDMAREILKEYGNYEWLTEKGSFVILQNGIENVVTYMAMLLTLLVFGPGRISLDALIEKRLKKKE
jgi:uncharacterized membrane protein YphA (DoxX/SURF4 family)